MPKHSNNRPWPDNLRYDFNLPPTISSSDAEAFISSLPTTERNRTFLRLRYREGKTYAEIASAHDMTPAGVRLAIIAMQEKFGGSAISTQVTAVEKVVPQSASTPAPTATTPPTVPTAPPLPTVPAAPPQPTKDERSARPLSINLATVRRTLNLTPEEFARPLPIEDGESLITRLETFTDCPHRTGGRMPTQKCVGITLDDKLVYTILLLPSSSTRRKNPAGHPVRAELFLSLPRFRKLDYTSCLKRISA